MGNDGSSNFTDIGFIRMASDGNEQDFGDGKAGNGSQVDGASGSTRGLFSGMAPAQTSIDYIQHSTKGNAADFGDTTSGRFGGGFVANDTRAVYGGGATPSRLNVIDFVTIATVGNATDFGDLTTGRAASGEGGSSTRGLYVAGTSPSDTDIIDYVTIASAGNATDFGDISSVRINPGSANSSTRSVFLGGAGSQPGYTKRNIIEYVTTASTGNTTDFGDLSTATTGPANGFASNNTRGLFVSGYTPSYVTLIEKITIASTGNASTFGNLTGARSEGGLASNGHGSLS